MTLSRVFLQVLGSGLIVSFSVAATAQPQYPAKPIRIITSEPGSSLDFTARAVSQGIAGALKQTVIVENRRVGPVEIVAKSQPDGYTLLAWGPSLWYLPMLREVTYDPFKDFAPITLAANSVSVLVVTPSVPANSVKELIALAKARPGVLNYASSVIGGTPHLAAELFKSMAGVDIVRVGYKGVAIAVTDVMSGQVQIMFASVPSSMPHVKAGKLKALAVTSAQPSILAPGLPTVASSGLPGYEQGGIYGLFAPAGTPHAIVNRLHGEIVRALNAPETKTQFFNAGLEIIGNTPQQTAAYMKTDVARMGKVIKEAGIRED